MGGLKVVNISKKIGGKKILDNVNLTIPEGVFMALLGPAGAGKTTLLRIIAGVESPDSGKIIIDDKDVTNLPPKYRNVAMVYQTFALYPHMNVFDNIANPLKARGMKSDEIRRKVMDVTRFLGISHLLERFPRELSGGEMQRVALARAIVKDAYVYLLDEPLTNLDYKLREKMREELRAMSRRMKFTIIYATSDPIDALTMADQVAVILNGKIKVQGPVQEVYQRPCCVDVAAALSSPPINLIDAVVERRNGTLILKTPFTEIEGMHWADKLSTEREYLIGIRPHQLTLLKDRRAEYDVVLEAKLRLAHVIGSETICYVSLSGYDLRVLLPYIYRMREVEEKVFIGFNYDDLMIFDRQTRVRVV